MYTTKLKNFDLKSIAESGQCFRMNMTGEKSANLIAFNRSLNITEDEDKSFTFDCDEDDFNNIWKHYFDLETDYSSFIKAIPESDRFLTEAAKDGDGIRILNQDHFETLISFIISQRKNIPAIKACVESLSRKYGEKLSSGAYAFPTPEALANASVDELNSCSLGYRTKYVKNTACAVARGDVDLDVLCKLNDEDLHKALLEFNGVGKKVANCVMLFSYHRIAAFPVDVWIQRVIDEKYNGSFPL
nr:DNA-3-methyladenine glycosylase 2 family protein [Lachnospiraceae bacterium]